MVTQSCVAVVAFLVLCAVAAEASRARIVLIGKVGDGKTYFCNKIEHNRCGAECLGENRCTVQAWTGGDHVIDTEGLGSNNKAGKLDTPDAFLSTLHAVNETYIRAIVWVVGCLEHRTTGEMLKPISLFVRMLGPAIPLVAVFNTGNSSDPGLVCHKDPAGFVAKAREWGLNVREVILMDQFDIETFETDYSTEYRVNLGSAEEVDRLILTLDADALASELERIRNMQCEKIPEHLESTRTELARLRGSVQSETNVPACGTRPCFAPPVNGENCYREYCAEYNWIGPFRNGCARHEIVADQACIARVAASAENSKKSLDACVEAANKDRESCGLAADQKRKEIRMQNAEIAKQVALLEEEEEVASAKLRDCDRTA